MEVRSITGDDAINELMTQTMCVTLSHLVDEGLLTKDKATEISDSRVAILTSGNFMWNRIKRWFSAKEGMGEVVIILKVTAPRRMND